MEINLINDKKLKIILSPFDMSKYDINCESISYDDTHTRKILWDILDVAKEKSGFDAAQNKIYIQLFPSKNGGCELYVTKISENDPPMPKGSENSLQGGADALTENVSVYGFLDIDKMLEVCHHLNKKGYIGESSAYAVKSKGEDKNKYFLLLDENIPFFSYKCKSLNQNAFISEFGTRYTSQSVIYYLKEHGSCICNGNAVKILSDI